MCLPPLIYFISDEDIHSVSQQYGKFNLFDWCGGSILVAEFSVAKSLQKNRLGVLTTLLLHGNISL
jgi:hypothetical protein